MSILTVRRVARALIGHSQVTANVVNLFCFAAAGLLAFLLRFDLSVPPRYHGYLLVGLAVWVPVKEITFACLRLDRGWWRYASVSDIVRVAYGNVVGSAMATVILLLVSPPGFPRSLYILDFVLCLGITAGARLVVRLAVEFSRVSGGTIKKRTLIYGAGDAGVSLLREIHSNRSLAYEVVGFVDDDPKKTGSVIHRAKVFGGGAALAGVVTAHSIDMVLIALPSATGPEMTRVLRYCQDAGVAFKTVPGLAEVIEGKALTTQIRDVAVEDLLGRTPAALEHGLIAAKVTGRMVMVSGAAGSIGSEMCRQIARFDPAGIVGFEIGETALFHLEREMRQSFPGVPFYAEIGSIQNRQRIAEVLEQHRPAVVFHAAAYKHVPMMEAHAFEAVENNVFGTLNLALEAGRSGVEDFVMISSDKAVRPTNVMGATKRLAELVILSLQNGGTKFVAVRFGNVLGSNGSVIPIFKQQIASGGPVTVTHAEMRRYFMTIPEAAQLVLQASTMGRGGEIFVLDMGDPVKIVDLARNLILLSGLRPDVDIKIEFSGVRPGEKLYEELSLMEEETIPTPHEKIRIFGGQGLPEAVMDGHLEGLRETCRRRDLARLILTLKEMIPDYNPSKELLGRALELAAGRRVVGTGV